MFWKTGIGVVFFSLAACQNTKDSEQIQREKIQLMAKWRDGSHVPFQLTVRQKRYIYQNIAKYELTKWRERDIMSTMGTGDYKLFLFIDGGKSVMKHVVGHVETIGIRARLNQQNINIKKERDAKGMEFWKIHGVCPPFTTTIFIYCKITHVFVDDSCSIKNIWIRPKFFRANPEERRLEEIFSRTIFGIHYIYYVNESGALEFEAIRDAPL